jgi:hypothetical protein
MNSNDESCRRHDRHVTLDTHGPAAIGTLAPAGGPGWFQRNMLNPSEDRRYLLQIVRK